ncbi:MAG TPA: signal peptidase II [Chthoniobacterales bacterium]|jgi:signal peptidase II|nr:signal peptidase II [Chthoniobacterales bacterium]
MKYIFFVSLPLYVLDRATKYLVLHSIDPDRPIVVVQNFFHLVNITNTGAAFGSFKNNNTFFIVISCLAALLALVLLVVQHRPTQSGAAKSVWWISNAWRDVSLALLLAGVLGNLTDRMLYGHVIDFLLFDLHIPFAHPWPAFNVADSCICFAVIFFMIHSFRTEKKTSEPVQP